ncbi:general odorant-binding protein 72-like [Phymastichus coffea]|uniref:general odorant-binding protein 72-like n=1 Tax=Phymastichus coffea TaxID=108790 RepID=UPI00273C9D82|nr:general odorant-binding protein 72-like [Phymastichus coffea]
MQLLNATVTLVIIVIMHKTVDSKMTIDQIKNTMKPYKNKCLRVTGVDPDIVEGTKSGNFPSDPKLMCFTKCIYNMMKVIKNDDLSLKEIFKTVDLMVPDEYVPQMKKIIEDCLGKANTKTSDLCEKSWLLSKCFYESDSSLYFFP